MNDRTVHPRGERGGLRPARHRFGAAARTRAVFVAGLLLAALLAAGAPGCAKKKSAPTEPPTAQLPPVVVEAYPAPRSTAVPYDTEIWVEFADPLDSLTVNAENVFLKVDTQRLPVTVRYESATRTLRIVPQAQLALRRTHTVEITPRVHTQDGGAFASTWFWQFTTNSLRYLDPPDPPAGATNVSPVTPLVWNGTEASAGGVIYQIYSGPDSAQVAARTGTPVATTRFYSFATTPRPPGALYWAVHAVNQSTGETLDSPVWRFEVIADGTPVDSVIVALRWWGYFFTPRPALTCNPAQLPTGASYISAARWDVGAIPTRTQLAAAALLCNTTTVIDVALRVPSIYATTAPVRDNCLIINPGPPFADEALGPLAFARSGPANQLRYDTALFASHLQATINGGGFGGYMLRSSGTVIYTTQELKLYYYRTP